MIVCDNIIFELQRFGGVSKYWAKNIEYLDKSTLDVSFLEGINAKNNYYRNQIKLNGKIINDNNPSFIKKFFNPKIKANIFHSSYYRISNNSKINIVTIHDFINELYPSRITDKVLSIKKKKACFKASKILTVSENTKKDLLKLYSSIDPEKIEVIYNGVDDEFYPEKIFNIFEINKRYILPNLYFLYVGNRGYCKNFNYVLNFFSKSLNVNKKLKLIIVGGGDFTKNEKLVIKDLKVPITAIIKFNGIDTNSLRKLYSNALATLIPSIYEGFGIPALEAAKCGCIVIGSKGNSLEEIIGNSEFFVNLNLKGEIDRVLSLLCNDNKLLIERGRVQNISNLFSWENSSKKLLSIYFDMLQKN